MLSEKQVEEMKGAATATLVSLHDCVEEPGFKLALAILVLANDRDEWRRYAERLPPAASAWVRGKDV